MGTRQLLALRAVAATGSIARAAASLGWSQPTVVHHLRALEREAGATMVAASHGGTVLTPAGHSALPHAIAVLERLQRAEAEVRAFVADGRRRVRLGVFPTAAARLLPSLVPALRRRGIDVTVREGEVDALRHDLAELRIDAAMLYTTEIERSDAATSTFAVRSLFSEPLVLMVAAGHPLAASAGLALADAAGEEWILGAHAGEPLETLLRARAATAGFTPREAARSDDYRVVAAYVAAGMGVALVPASAVHPAGAEVVGVALRDAGFVRHVRLVTSAALAGETRAALLEEIDRAHRATATV